MMSDEKELIEFPCQFKIKIIGNNNDVFIKEIMAITYKHFPDHQEDSVLKSYSKNNTFLGLTVNVYALNKDILDNYYREITAHPDVKWVI